MAERSSYADLNRNQLRNEIALRKLPGKAVSNKELIAILEADDRKTGKRPQVAARAASPPRKGRIATPPKIRSEVDQRRLDDRLLRAAGKSDLGTVERAIKAGADVNVAVPSGRTALFFAILRGNTEMVKLLIRARVNVNVADEDGRTALIVASGLGHMNIVKILIEAGADVNAALNNRSTALMVAALATHMGIMEILIKAGADPEMRNNDGRTVRDIFHNEVVASPEYDQLMEEFERMIEESTPKRMVKAARQSPARSPQLSRGRSPSR